MVADWRYMLSRTEKSGAKDGETYLGWSCRVAAAVFRRIGLLPG